MKKIFTLSVFALAAMGMSAEDYVLDLSTPSYPEEINFVQKGNAQIWESTYDEDEYVLEFEPFLLYHLMSGTSYGNTYWDGFTVVKCNDSSKQADFVTNQWGNMAGGGVADDGTTDASKPYLLAYAPDFMGPGIVGVEFDTDDTYFVKGMYVNMSSYAYYSCADGDSFSPGLQNEGDSFKLQAIGKLNGETTKTIEIELAGRSNGQFHALTDWTWWDMSELGEVDHILFNLTSTDTSEWGMNTPSYFAMDKLTVSDEIPTAVDNVETAKAVSSVKYVNVAGQTSEVPFDGMNVKVTTYTDGTQSTIKMVK